MRRSSTASIRSTSDPSSNISPPVLRPFVGRSRNSAAANVLLPDPDSPSTPKISPAPTPKLTSSNARHTPSPRPPYATQRSRTWRTCFKSAFSLYPFNVEPPSSTRQGIRGRLHTNGKQPRLRVDPQLFPGLPYFFRASDFQGTARSQTMYVSESRRE